MTTIEQAGIRGAVRAFLATMSDEALDNAPCGCPECSQAPQPGHFACEAVGDIYVAAEEVGMIARAYDDGRWRWFKTGR